MRRLSDLARVRFGVKTGANEFFYVTDDGQSADSEERRAKAEGGLQPLSGIAAVRRGLTTGANEFFYLTRPPTQLPTPDPQSLTPVHDASGETRVIESRFLSPVVFSLKEIAGIAFEQVDNGKLFFNCAATLDELAGTNALDYIRSGERAGYDQRPSCASREPWYSVANGRKPAPLLFPSKVGERWLVALNRARVFEDKKLYGIFPARGVSELALAALLNSTWARYYAEITCRQMTGAQAIADIDVAVAEQILIPDPRDLSPAIRKKLDAALMALTHRPVYSIFEEVKRADRRKLDCLTLEAIGFGGPGRNVVLEQLYEAATDLVRARLSRVS
jgi:hypothetical protein